MIDGEKIYNVARIENKADNPFIRIRISGGIKDGLNIHFTKYDDDNFTIAKYKVMTYYS